MEVRSVMSPEPNGYENPDRQPPASGDESAPNQLPTSGYEPPDLFQDGYLENPYERNPFDNPYTESLANPNPNPTPQKQLEL
jgi:hypothetical protein